MGKKILTVAAHSDDEVLGSRATIAKHGDATGVLFLTDGVNSRYADTGVQAEEREAVSHRVLTILGARIIGQLSLPVNEVDSISRRTLIQAIEVIIHEFCPDIRYTHHGGDLNIDHRRALEGVLTACHPQSNNSARAIYSVERTAIKDGGLEVRA